MKTKLTMMLLFTALACREKSETAVAAPEVASSAVQSSSSVPVAEPTPEAIVMSSAEVSPAVAASGTPQVAIAAAPAMEAHHDHGKEKAGPSTHKGGDPVSTIMDPSSFSSADVRDTYAKARLVADRLDQMYCYCQCGENDALKHKSLLTCFQSDHAAECGICLAEGKQAWLDWKDGLPVDVTIKTVDIMYNQGNPAPSMPH